MRKKFVLIILSLMSLLFILSCSNIWDNNIEETGINTDNINIETGLIKLSLPQSFPFYSNGMVTEGRQSESNTYSDLSLSSSVSWPNASIFTENSNILKAYGIINSLICYIKNNKQELVESWSVSLENYRYGDTRLIKVGSAYTLTVEIFNVQVSTTVPTVRGVSEPFDVVANTITPVTVKCLPLNYLPSVSGTNYAYSAKPTYLIENNEGLHVSVSTGGECWYSMTADSTYTIFQVTSDTFAIFNVYDSEGTGISGMSPILFLDSNPSFPLKLLTPTIVGKKYYIVLIPLTFTPATSITTNFSFYSKELTDDMYENNNDFNTATDIPLSQAIAGKSLDDDYFKFTIDSSQGTRVILSITYSGIDSVKFFNGLFLYNPLQEEINWAYALDNKDQTTFTIENLTDGNYFLYMQSLRIGIEYTIEWHYE